MTTDYQIWITANGEKEKLQLPVNPETLSVSNGSHNDSIDITELGEITIKQGRPALQFKFSSFFPASSFPGIKVKTLTAPLTIIKKIEAWKESDKPVHFIVTQCKIDLYCTIEDFSYSESGGDVGTYEYSIKLVEYREITVRQVKVNISVGKATVKKTEQRVDNTMTGKTYTVKSGDCLWNIAKAHLGSGSRWQEIYNLNKSVIGSNPNLIYPGQVYTLPAA